MEENNKALLILNYLSFKDIILSLVHFIFSTKKESKEIQRKYYKL